MFMFALHTSTFYFSLILGYNVGFRTVRTLPLSGDSNRENWDLEAWKADSRMGQDFSGEWAVQGSRGKAPGQEGKAARLGGCFDMKIWGQADALLEPGSQLL